MNPLGLCHPLASLTALGEEKKIRKKIIQKKQSLKYLLLELSLMSMGLIKIKTQTKHLTSYEMEGKKK